jgi:hypothetical protein
MIARRARLALIAVAFAALALRGAGPAEGQTSVHGATSEFAHPTLKLVWAIRKGATEDATDVVIRAANVADAYRWLRVDGVDPFSKARVVLTESRPFERQTDLVIRRAKFADHPSAEIHLFRSEDDLRAERPALTVFYLGIPDTTPEFTRAEAVDAHLARMLGEAR